MDDDLWILLSIVTVVFILKKFSQVLAILRLNRLLVEL